MMTIYSNPDPTTLKKILKRPLFDVTNLNQIVREILQVIQSQGDEALKNYTERFDKVSISNFQVTEQEIESATKQISDDLIKAIQLAYSNIERFHATQQLKNKVVETMSGVQCWQKSVAIEKVGLYIPGGTAPLFSSVLMLAIPAKIAGCKEIILCTPPNKEGKVHPAILYTAQLAGVTQIYKLGGAQAVAAMAYGTQTIPQVYKIFGPGNQYVTAAKQLVSQQGTAIDMPAGPSEVLVVAGAGANPEFVAADLLSQAEHGIDSQVVLLSFDEEMAKSCQKALEKQLETLPRKEIARKALANSPIIVIENEEIATTIINDYAPEHLILSMDNALSFAEGIVNAGSVFLGHFTPESVGDYASGTNHTLPTNGFARAFSGINLDAYVKKITYQQLSPEGLQQIGPAVEIMAATEGLQAHKLAVSVRLNSLKGSNQ